MNFAGIVETLTATDDGSYRITVTQDWAQGRATFGGLITGIANETLRQLIPRERVLRSLQTTFIGPAAAGTWQIRPRVLRVGKAVSIASCEVFDNDQIVATIVGVYGGARRSVLKVDMQVPQLEHSRELTGPELM